MSNVVHEIETRVAVTSTRRLDTARSTRLSVVVVNWNSRDDLEVCLRALARQTHDDLEVIVVDNGSRDGSEAMAREKFPRFSTIQTHDNLGFAEACNIGIEASTGEWVAMLNNDTRADDGWARALVEAAREAPASCGMLQSVMLFMSKPHTINSAGLALTRSGSGVDLHEGEPSSHMFANDDIFCPSAGAAAYRRSMLDAIKLPCGYFDRDHFMYYEDLDLGWRARLAGWSAKIVPRSIVHHKWHGSSDRHGRSWLVAISRTNRLRTLLKNASPWFLLRTAPKSAYEACEAIWHGGLRTAASMPRMLLESLRRRRAIGSIATQRRASIESRWANGGRVRTPRPKKTVLIDLTPLYTADRHRGIGRYLMNLAKGLQAIPERERDGLRFLGLHRLGLDGSFDVSEDLTPRDFGRPENHRRRQFARRLWLGRVARRVGADLVHLGDTDATPLLSSTPRVATCHDLIPLRYPAKYLDWRHGYATVASILWKRRFGSADHVVAISDATANDLGRYLRVPPTRVTRVYNGSNLSAFSSEKRDSDAMLVDMYDLSTRPFLLYVGDIDWRKNVEGMLGGLARARANGVDVAIAFAGKHDERHATHLDELVRAHDLVPFVHSLGFVPDEHLVSLYRAALAHLFVSRCEGFGLTVVEAMASGCPVITTAGGSLAEVAGDAALLVDPESNVAIGDAIVKLARDPMARRELVRLGLARVPRFALEVQARDMLAIYRRLSS